MADEIREELLKVRETFSLREHLAKLKNEAESAAEAVVEKIEEVILPSKKKRKSDAD